LLTTVGLANSPSQGGQRRLGPDHAAAALQAFQHGGFLAADIRPGADPNLQGEGAARTGDVFAEIAGIGGKVDGAFHGGYGVGVFGPQIDQSLGRAGGDAGDDHPLDDDHGVAFHDHAVGEGAAVAFIGVAADIFLFAFGPGDRLPLDAGGETGAAAPAQPRFGDLGDDFGGFHSQRLGEPGKTAMGLEIIDGKRVDDAAAGKGQPNLAGEIGDLLGGPMAQRVVRAVQEAALEQARDVLGRHRPVSDAPLGGFDLHQGLQPQQAARAVAHHADIDLPARRLPGDRRGHGVGAHRQCRRVTRHKDGPAAHGALPRRSATRASNLSASTRVCRLSPTKTDGPRAQFPRQ